MSYPPSNLVTADYPDVAQTFDPSATTSQKFTQLQINALKGVLSGDLNSIGRLSASSTVSLHPSIRYGLWFPFSETSVAFLDRIAGKTLTTGGTVTNLFVNAGYATLDADTRLILRNDSYVDELFRLDTLEGSILMGMEVFGTAPSTTPTPHLWGYGDNGNTTLGGYSFPNVVSATESTAQAFGLAHAAIGGSTNVTHGFNLSALLLVKKRRFIQIAVHRFGGKIWMDGYESGFHSRSSRIFALESGPPTVATQQGLRIGSRPNGTSGGAANYVGAVVSGAKLRNFYALRISGDYRHKVPSWTAALAQSLPYNLFPDLNNG